MDFRVITHEMHPMMKHFTIHYFQYHNSSICIKAPPAAFQLYSNERYLQMRVQSRSFDTVRNSTAEMNELEELDLNTDIQTILSDSEANDRGSQPAFFHGQIDIILHPIYLVPCPYIQLHGRNGQSMSVTELRDLIITQRSPAVAHPYLGRSFSGSKGMVDEEVEEVEVTIEEHPYNQAICLCPHLCGLGQRLALLSKSDSPPLGCHAGNGVSKETDRQPIPIASDSEVDSNVDYLESPDFYLLNWFILVGPTIGIRHSPSFYSKFKHAVNSFH